jgi:hypothetical protein
MEQKVLKPLNNTIQHDLDGLTIDQAIARLMSYKTDYYSGKEVVISWEQAQWSDDYELALYERRDETDVEEAERLVKEEQRRLQQLEHKKRQLAALKKELGDE